MSLLKKISSMAKPTASTGFGEDAQSYGGRFVNKEGMANIRKTGLGFFTRFSWFHSMLRLSWTHFLLMVLAFFVFVNLAFAVIYYLLGVEHLAGMKTGSEIEKFAEAFFFSAQTFTTVGYGRISPLGFVTSAISSLQALMGLLSFAVATGLMYGRFSKPRAFIKFSHNALIGPYKNITGLMLRLAPYKNNTLTDAEARVTLRLSIDEGDKHVNSFYTLDLELNFVSALTLSWTLVHPITENSPLYGFVQEDLKNAKAEIIVFIKAFDDMFSNTVVARTSYIFNEVVFNAKFIPMFKRDQTNHTTILDFEKLNEYEFQKT